MEETANKKKAFFQYFTARFAATPGMKYIVLGIMMITNMVTEFLFDKFVVFRNQENTAKNASNDK
ncbi:MAG: hypothetical protein IJU96_07380 [Clostridia bacterium]|nr:hypothetical protein [Clostridia bacterium]